MKNFLLSIGVSFVTMRSLSAQENEIFVKDNAAIGGYDVVAYFKESKPMKGMAEFSVTYNGVNWFFASKTNADLFRVTPEKYEPQYGGYSAFGCSSGYKATISPDAWTIVGDKLYLNYNTDVRNEWNKDQQG